MLAFQTNKAHYTSTKLMCLVYLLEEIHVSKEVSKFSPLGNILFHPALLYPK